MRYKPRKIMAPVLVCTGVFIVLLVATICYIAKDRAPIAQNPSPERLAAIANQGIHCNDGKAWNNTVNSSGFQMSQAVVIDGQFVECAMVYKVDGQAMTLEELFIKLFYRDQKQRAI